MLSIAQNFKRWMFEKKWPQKNVKHEFFFRQTTPTTLDFNYPWPIVKKISIVWFGWWQYTEVSREPGRLIAAATIHCSKNGKIVQLIRMPRFSNFNTATKKSQLISFYQLVKGNWNPKSLVWFDGKKSMLDIFFGPFFCTFPGL